MTDLILGTRGSPLALKQAQDVRAMLEGKKAGNVEVRTYKTTGDLRTTQRFKEIGTKGLFTKELDEALLSEDIDFAVHSMKDLPSEMPSGLTLVCVPQAVDPRDAWLSRSGETFRSLPKGAKVGTSSLRRQALVRMHRPDLILDECRGNVETRLSKLAGGDFDAIILAHAGLFRLDLADRITEFLDPTLFFPAAGQGMLAVVCREGDARTRDALGTIHDAASGLRAEAERYFLSQMDGGCSVPLGCHLRAIDRGYAMGGFLAKIRPQGELMDRMVFQTEGRDAMECARLLVKRMKDAGSDEWISEMKSE